MMNVETLIDMLAQIDRQLERIAVVLERLGDDASRCGHGATGLCMACVIQHDLMRPR